MIKIILNVKSIKNIRVRIDNVLIGTLVYHVLIDLRGQICSNIQSYNMTNGFTASGYVTEGWLQLAIHPQPWDPQLATQWQADLCLPLPQSSKSMQRDASDTQCDQVAAATEMPQ